jgi:UDP-2,3-diacylglucosamine hydrolase
MHCAGQKIPLFWAPLDSHFVFHFVSPGKNSYFFWGRLDTMDCDFERTFCAIVNSELTSSSTEPLGIIAGNRTLPLVFAEQARRFGGYRLVAVAFEGETDPILAQLVDEIIWIKVGQLSKLISAFTERQVRQCVMVGQIAPKNLFDVRPDLRAVGVLLRLKEKNAHSIFGAIADELHKEGVELVSAIPWLEPIMAPAGFRFGPELSSQEEEDLQLGFRVAKEISRLDIGQSVVVKAGAILAVEAFEGTDKCLLRGGELAGKNGGAVAVKVAKESHDLRFDIPCIGPQTIETCATARIRVLGLEPGKNLILEQENVEALAKKDGLTLLTVT